MLRTSGGRRIKGSGIRGDVRALYLRKGIALDHGTHAVPSLGASLFVRF
jgi:hypothetical protein